MNENEVKFLTKQLIEKAGFDPEFSSIATDLFINLHPDEVSKTTYSQNGVDALSSAVETWKESPTGKRFLPQDTPKTNKQLTTKEIAERFKNGKLKLQYY